MHLGFLQPSAIKCNGGVQLVPCRLELQQGGRDAGFLAIDAGVTFRPILGDSYLQIGSYRVLASCSVRYYRTSNASVDLRRCRDFGVGSGCVGGVSDGEGPCKPGLEVRCDIMHGLGMLHSRRPSLLSTPHRGRIARSARSATTHTTIARTSRRACSARGTGSGRSGS